MRNKEISVNQLFKGNSQKFHRFQSVDNFKLGLSHEADVLAQINALHDTKRFNIQSIDLRNGFCLFPRYNLPEICQSQSQPKPETKWGKHQKDSWATSKSEKSKSFWSRYETGRESLLLHFIIKRFHLDFSNRQKKWTTSISRTTTSSALAACSQISSSSSDWLTEGTLFWKTSLAGQKQKRKRLKLTWRSSITMLTIATASLR